MTRKEQKDFVRAMLGDYTEESYTDSFINKSLDLADVFQCMITQYLIRTNFDIEKLDIQGYILDLTNSAKIYMAEKKNVHQGFLILQK